MKEALTKQVTTQLIDRKAYMPGSASVRDANFQDRVAAETRALLESNAG